MTLYLGNAKSQTPAEVAKQKEAVRGSTRPQYARNAERDASRDEDEGECDNEHPDSSWVEGWNRGQRGEA